MSKNGRRRGPRAFFIVILLLAGIFKLPADEQAVLRLRGCVPASPNIVGSRTADSHVLRIAARQPAALSITALSGGNRRLKLESSVTAELYDSIIAHRVGEDHEFRIVTTTADWHSEKTWRRTVVVTVTAK